MKRLIAYGAAAFAPLTTAAFATTCGDCIAPIAPSGGAGAPAPVMGQGWLGLLMVVAIAAYVAYRSRAIRN
jgi:hypothetical protein